VALLQNNAIAAQYPLHPRGATQERAFVARGNRRNVFAGAGGWAAKSGIPSGNLAPSSWVLPLKTGGLSSHNSAQGVATASGAMASGRNIAATADGVATATGSGQLVTSGVGSAAGVATVSGNVIAALSGSAAAAGVATASGSITAKAWGVGASAGVATTSAVRYATGELIGSIAPAVELDAAIFSTYLLDEEDVETGLTLRQALRLIAAATGGKVSGGGTTTITFRNAVADDQDRITATVDVDGNRTSLSYDLD
jgi:hypothetical protein